MAGLLVLLLIPALIGLAVYICMLIDESKLHVVFRDGLPFCPRCNRQVSLRRQVCRACGLDLRTPYTPALGDVIRSSMGIPPCVVPSTGGTFGLHPFPKSHWERLHDNPDDFSAASDLRDTIEDALKRRLMGTKEVERLLVTDAVVLRRSGLQYEQHVCLYIGPDRHGFEIAVPTHKLKIRITCPRIVPDDVLGAPWDDLLENICKIDRSIIKIRGSKSKSLVYVPIHGEHPSLKVEILQKPHKQQKGLPQDD